MTDKETIKIMLDYLIQRYGFYELYGLLKTSHDRLQDYIDHGNINHFMGPRKNERVKDLFNGIAGDDRLKQIKASIQQSDNK